MAKLYTGYAQLGIIIIYFVQAAVRQLRLKAVQLKNGLIPLQKIMALDLYRMLLSSLACVQSASDG
jgi:hypothetical protein